MLVYIAVTVVETFAKEAATQAFLFLLQSSYYRVWARMCSFRDFICKKQPPTFVVSVSRKEEDHSFIQKLFMLASHFFSECTGHLLPAVYKDFAILVEIYQISDKRQNTC